MLVTAVLVVAVVRAVVVMIVLPVLSATAHFPASQWRPGPHSVPGSAAAFGDFR